MDKYTNVTSTATGRTDKDESTTFTWLLVTPQPGNRGHTTLGLSVKVSGIIDQDGQYSFDTRDTNWHGIEVYSRPPTKDYWLDNYGMLPKVILVTTDTLLKGTGIHIWRSKPAHDSLERLVMLRKLEQPLPTNFTAWELAGHGPDTDYFMTEHTNDEESDWGNARVLDPTTAAEQHTYPLYQRPHDAGLTQLSHPTRHELIARGFHRLPFDSRVSYSLWDWDDAVAYERKQMSQYRKSKSVKSKLRSHNAGGSQ